MWPWCIPDICIHVFNNKIRKKIWHVVIFTIINPWDVHKYPLSDFIAWLNPLTTNAMNVFLRVMLFYALCERLYNYPWWWGGEVSSGIMRWGSRENVAERELVRFECLLWIARLKRDGAHGVQKCVGNRLLTHFCWVLFLRSARGGRCSSEKSVFRIECIRKALFVPPWSWRPASK